MPQTNNDEEIKEVTQDVEDLDFNNPSFVFKPEANHDWRQRGPYLVCKGCDIEHGVYVGVEKILIGFDEKGEPIMKSREELGMG